MGNMRYCTQCGHALEPEAKFCENCGAPVAASGEQKKKNETDQVFTPRRSGVRRPSDGKPSGQTPAGLQRRGAENERAGSTAYSQETVRPQRRAAEDRSVRRTGGPGYGQESVRPQRRAAEQENARRTGSTIYGQESAGPQHRAAETRRSAGRPGGTIYGQEPVRPRRRVAETGNTGRTGGIGYGQEPEARIENQSGATRYEAGQQQGPSIPDIGREHAFSPQRPMQAAPPEWRQGRSYQYGPEDTRGSWDPEEADEEEGRFTTLQYVLLGFIGVLIIALLTFGAFWLIGRSKNHSSKDAQAGQVQTGQTTEKGTATKETGAIQILDDGEKQTEQTTAARSETTAGSETTAQTEAAAITLNYTDFTVTLPADWKGKYGITQQGDNYIFYQQSSKALGYNGTLFTIAKYTDLSYQDLPNYRMLGTGGGAAYVLILPTDVQYAQNNEAAQKEYTAMADEIDQIIAGVQILVSGDGPKQTETASTDVIQIQGQQTDDSEYLLPESSERALTDADVDGMSYDDLQMAINEIYARHGRTFGNESIQNYFNSKSWYQGTTDADHFSDSVFSSVENQNIEFLLKKMGIE